MEVPRLGVESELQVPAYAHSNSNNRVLPVVLPAAQVLPAIQVQATEVPAIRVVQVLLIRAVEAAPINQVEAPLANPLPRVQAAVTVPTEAEM